jgi:hypothetical protein
MKRLILGSLSILPILGATAPAVRVQIVQNQTEVTNPANSSSQLTPFILVDKAYRGDFKSQGIPSYGALIFAYQFGSVTAKDLVEAAIRANRLSPQTLADRGYVNAVKARLAIIANEDH